jgi:hypothetical protein
MPREAAEDIAQAIEFDDETAHSRRSGDIRASARRRASARARARWDAEQPGWRSSDCDVPLFVYNTIRCIVVRVTSLHHLPSDDHSLQSAPQQPFRRSPSIRLVKCGEAFDQQ